MGIAGGASSSVVVVVLVCIGNTVKCVAMWSLDDGSCNGRTDVGGEVLARHIKNHIET